MLVLGRKLGEQLLIETASGDVVVCIGYIKGERIGVGIIAPKSCTVTRFELLDAERQRGIVEYDEKIRLENAKAARLAPTKGE